MDLILLLVGLAVGACDPVLFVAPIVAAFFSRGRWWIVPLIALIWGGVLEGVRFQLMPGYAGEELGEHLGAALLNGLVVAGIAGLIRKLRGPDRYPARQQNSAAPK